MFKAVKKCLLFILSLVTFVSMVNCNKVKMTAIDNANPTANLLTDPVDTAYVQDSCNTLPHQTMTKGLSFPKPAITCEWGKNGNLAIRDHYFQARIEQEQRLTLPADSILCDIKFNFAVQQFLYDDHFLVTFNNAVIASSYNFDSVLTSQNGLLRYDWSRMAGMYWDQDTKEGTFCSGGGSCSWPITDTPGVISMDYDSLVFQKIMAENLNRSEHSVQFISIGDNDDQDCEHSDINFTMDVEYVTKQPVQPKISAK